MAVTEPDLSVDQTSLVAALGPDDTHSPLLSRPQESSQNPTCDRDTQTEDLGPLSCKAQFTEARACTAALQCAELLEMILLFLPLRRIIRIKRVNKSWRDTVEGSINIQRALFLAPLDGSVARYHSGDETARITIMRAIGPLESTAAKLVPEIFPNVGTWIHPSFKRNEKPVFVMNPLLKPFFRNVRTRRKDNMGMELTPEYCTLDTNDLEAISGGNWRTALLVQPARSFCSVYCSCLRRGELVRTRWLHATNFFGHFWVENEAGITMGDLVDRIRNHRQSCRGVNWQVGENVNVLSALSHDLQWLPEDCTGADVLAL